MRESGVAVLASLVVVRYRSYRTRGCAGVPASRCISSGRDPQWRDWLPPWEQQLGKQELARAPAQHGPEESP
ncbi:hypothetical protein NDU88_006614 [Pleurodeles waltl]|uniref:Secreted protein n=1 Tax=Pleurodeles waltl TaxID=8319 RepID=A0AAV7MZS3_PLEWA|nr:hypothetical protein NDU88_006614 [Pleurodeles waltl]